jgi:hypothetical protein
MKDDNQILSRIEYLINKAAETRYKIRMTTRRYKTENYKDTLNEIEACIAELKWVLNIGKENNF